MMRAVMPNEDKTLIKIYRMEFSKAATHVQTIHNHHGNTGFEIRFAAHGEAGGGEQRVAHGQVGDQFP